MAAEIGGQSRVTLGAGKGYDKKAFVRALREYRVTPHVAQKVNSAIDRRSTCNPGYLLSQRCRRVEETFSWLNTVAGLRKTRHREIARVGWTFTSSRPPPAIWSECVTCCQLPIKPVGQRPAPSTLDRLALNPARSRYINTHKLMTS